MPVHFSWRSVGQDVKATAANKISIDARSDTKRALNMNVTGDKMGTITLEKAGQGQSKSAVATYDAVVIGAGVAGLYQLHRLREMGMSVRAYDTASGVGGTWYWNRYPGARFDSQAEIYQYWFSEELYKSWQPSERFPAQPETERWLNYVADKLDLKKDIQFSTRIASAHFDEAEIRCDLTSFRSIQLMDQAILGLGTWQPNG